ncbi:MAG: HAMP domain-containing protein [Desulfacinum sp.]|nr:HAMP domain-containing protein [Desulfacinum sp.]
MQRVRQLLFSLQGKVLMIVASTVLVVFFGAAGANWWMQRERLLQEGLETGRLLADSVYASIKHPMATGAEGALEQQLMDIGAKFQDLDIYIYDFAGKVTYATREDQLRSDLRSLGLSGNILTNIESSLSGQSVEQKVALEETQNGPKIAVVTPILNEPSCYHCHGASRKVLGGLLVRRDASPLFAHLAKMRTLSAVGSLVGTMVLAGALVLILSFFVTRPLERIVGAIRRLAEGDLTVEIKHRSRDELGQLADSVNRLSQNFRDTLRQARETALKVSEGTSSQAASIEETSASLEEITSMIRQGADKCAEADSMMRDNDEKLVQANKVMKECMASFDQIVATTETMAGIIKDIDEIAFQTNLLALNAAVEAARAGEAGQGFAVVADEVRSLARRASEAAKSTGDLIRTAQLKTQEGRSLVQKTDAAYREVAIQARKVSQLIKDVAASGQEQSLGVEQISRAMHELEQVIQSFTTVTDQLTQMMDFFRTNGEQSGIRAPLALLPGRDLADPRRSGD